MNSIDFKKSRTLEMETIPNDGQNNGDEDTPTVPTGGTPETQTPSKRKPITASLDQVLITLEEPQGQTQDFATFEELQEYIEGDELRFKVLTALHISRSMALKDDTLSQAFETVLANHKEDFGSITKKQILEEITETYQQIKLDNLKAEKMEQYKDLVESSNKMLLKQLEQATVELNEIDKKEFKDTQEFEDAISNLTNSLEYIETTYKTYITAYGEVFDNLTDEEKSMFTEQLQNTKAKYDEVTEQIKAKIEELQDKKTKMEFDALDDEYDDMLESMEFKTYKDFETYVKSEELRSSILKELRIPPEMLKKDSMFSQIYSDATKTILDNHAKDFANLTKEQIAEELKELFDKLLKDAIIKTYRFDTIPTLDL